jgi:hypothetical protein
MKVIVRDRDKAEFPYGEDLAGKPGFTVNEREVEVDERGARKIMPPPPTEPGLIVQALPNADLDGLSKTDLIALGEREGIKVVKHSSVETIRQQIVEIRAEKAADLAAKTQQTPPDGPAQ